ncbi:MAG: response regulator [Desulfobacula sp.]|nr:response regulator [Desulfobacula sp.]
MMPGNAVPVVRILVIDDNAAIHEDFRKILIKPHALDHRLLDMEATLFGAEIRTEKRGFFEIDSAFQGRDGLALVQKALSKGHPYALAFVDGRMPPGWDGIETIHHLWQECPDLQVVLCTAYADYSWQEICRVLGETDNLLILKKPFDDVEVLQIAHALARKWELNREVQSRIENLDGMVRQKTEEKDRIGAMLEAALAHSPAGIIVSEAKEVSLRWANPAALNILGETLLFCPAKGEHGSGWRALRPDGIPYAPEDLPLFRAAIKGETIRNEQFIIRNSKGLEKWISSNAAPVRDADGFISAGILIFEDITELRKVQAEKIEALTAAAEAQKFALVGQIAGKMAHDFNNILGVIMGNSELALMDCPHEKTKKTLELILEQTLHGKNLTQNLVAFAKDHEPKQEFFDLNEKIELVIGLLKKDLEGIQVTREYSPDLPELLADPGMIEHAVVNLIQNSIHAVSLVRQPEIIIRTHHQKGRIIMEIEDNGCGIPEEFLGEIFEPSFSLKGSRDKKGFYKSGIKGTGYGMSNVKKYVNQHKGAISVRSKLQKGTKVTITLPVMKKELTAKEVREIKKEKICFKKYILLVEDEQAIADVQYRILTHESLSHKVDLAGSGKAAMDALNRNTYDLISLDYILPGDLNGMDVYHHIRKTDKTVPVLFISGNIEFLESIKALKQKDPHIEHLSKPCRNIDYVNCVNQMLGRSLNR